MRTTSNLHTDMSPLLQQLRRAVINQEEREQTREGSDQLSSCLSCINAWVASPALAYKGGEVHLCCARTETSSRHAHPSWDDRTSTGLCMRLRQRFVSEF